MDGDAWEDEDVFCRSRVWLLLAYSVSVGSMAGAVAVMIAQQSQGTGLASVLQVRCSCLAYFWREGGALEGEGRGGGGVAAHCCCLVVSALGV
jgi:hypothetical protein